MKKRKYNYFTNHKIEKIKQYLLDAALKLAIKTSPKKAKLILKNINKQDKKISSLLSKLSKY